MPFFDAPDRTRLAFHERGAGEPLVVLPGGPMRASAYLGNLGGLDAHRRLVLLDLRGTGESEVPADPATYRCDRLVDDVEALRLRLGLERMDLLAHSAGGSLAMLYAARYPQRIARLALITATPWALGWPATADDRRAAARLRAAEPWFADAFPAFEAWLDGSGGFDWSGWPPPYSSWPAGPTGDRSPRWPAGPPASSRTRSAWCSRAPGTTRGSTTRRGSRAGCPPSSPDP